MNPAWKKREENLKIFQKAGEWPLLLLSIIWLFLLVLDLLQKLKDFYLFLFYLIWFVFILNFIIELWIAKKKRIYLRKNWLTAVSLFIPAFRIFRLTRALRFFKYFRTGRGLQLIRLITSFRRGMKALAVSLNQRGFLFVLVLTVIVVFTGAAGMYAFERETTRDLSTYGSSLWWTAMIITTMGSDEWPRTIEGRILTLILALYSFSVFGYITASITTFFVGENGKRSLGKR